MASGPPPGLDVTEDFGPHVIGADIALMVISTIAVALRFGTRFAARQSLSWDDYLIILALVFAYGTGILSVLACNSGIGKHIWNPAVNIEKVLKILWAYEFMYGAVIPSTKMSIIMFYHRIFPVKSVTITLSCCAFLVLGWWIAIWVTAIAQCHPHSYLWEQYLNPMAKGSCINTYAFFLANGGLSVVTDCIILMVPMPMVWKLQMPTAQKMAVTGIFLLGGFVCIAGIVRLHFLSIMFVNEDFTWNMSQSFIWSCVEPCIGIVCACLPTLRPLLRTLFPKLFNSRPGIKDPNGSPGYGESGGTSGTGRSSNRRSGSRSSRDFVKLGGGGTGGAAGAGGGKRLSQYAGFGQYGGLNTTTTSTTHDDDDYDEYDQIGLTTIRSGSVLGSGTGHGAGGGVPAGEAGQDDEEKGRGPGVGAGADYGDNKIPLHSISARESDWR